MHFLEWKYMSSDQNFSEVCCQGPIKNIPALVQIMGWCQPMMVRSLMHICITQRQSVKLTTDTHSFASWVSYRFFYTTTVHYWYFQVFHLASHLSLCLSLWPSIIQVIGQFICLYVHRFLGAIVRKHGRNPSMPSLNNTWKPNQRNYLKHGMIIYFDDLQDWLDFSHGLSIFLILPQFDLMKEDKLRFPGIILKTHGRNYFKLGMVMSTGHLQNQPFWWSCSVDSPNFVLLFCWEMIGTANKLYI